MKNSLMAEAFETRQDIRCKVSLYRPIIIAAQGFRGIGLLRNVSSSGLMVTVFTELPLRTWATIYLVSEGVSAQVVWCENGDVGFEFAEAIDVDSVISNLGSVPPEGAGVARAPRLLTDCVATLARGTQVFEVRVLNVSQRGAMLRSRIVKSGDQCVLGVEGLPERRCEVKWASDGRAGVGFFTPLTIEEIARWSFSSNFPAEA